MLLFLGGIFYFLINIKIVLIPFIFGIILSYLFYPLVSFLRKRNITRTWAIYIMIIIFLMITLIFTIFVLPVFIKELEELSKVIPDYIKYIDKYTERLTKEYHRVYLPSIIKEVIDRILAKVEGNIITFIEKSTELIINILPKLFCLVISPIITYYLLKDLNKIKKNILRLVPRKKRRFFLELGTEINKIFVGYLRGQLWLSIFVGLLSIIGLFFFDIKFYLILGLFAGITNMIPYIGPIIGGIPAAFIALLSSPGKALAVIILFFVIQQIESSVLSPKIMSEEVGLHPLTVIFALLSGAELFGIWGILFAVPAAGSIKVIFKFIYYRLYK
ncbi:MAG: AI-2E family transporter [Halothermotrichaceae bacterium]